MAEPLQPLPKVNVCHWNGAGWNSIVVSQNSLSGHDNHAADVWPPVEADPDGMNWGTSLQAVWENGCAVPTSSQSPTPSLSPTPSPTSPTTSPSSTSSGTPEATPSQPGTPQPTPTFTMPPLPAPSLPPTPGAVPPPGGSAGTPSSPHGGAPLATTGLPVSEWLIPVALLLVILGMLFRLWSRDH